MAQTNVQAFSGDVEVAGTLTVSGTLTSTTGVDTVALATDATDASRPIIFSTGTTGSQPLKTDAGITYNPSTNTLSVAGGIDNVALAADATDASRPIIFSTGTTGSQSLKTDAGITYNPSTNTLSVAGGIDNVVLATDATDASRPIIFSTGTTGSQPLKTDPGITYNPSTNKLSVTGGLSTSISPGDYLTGTAYDGSTARTFAVDATDANTASKVVARDASGNFSAGTITAALTGNADTATTLQTARNINGVSFNGSANITITANTPTTLTRGNYLTGDNFNGGTGTTWAVDATSANTASKVVARDASGNFSAGTITAALTGNADTATKVNVTGRDNTNDTHYPTFTSTHADGNTDLYQDSGFTYNPSSGTLTSTTFSGALSGNASTASQVNVTSRDSEDASHYPTFTTTDADGNASLYQDAGFYYNPSTGTLTSTTFSGALSGNASTASQVNVTSRDSEDAVHYPTFTTTHDDGNTDLYQDSGFTYNPSSGTLTSTTFAGALTGNADTATTATNQSGGTVSATSGTFSGNVSFTDSGTTKRGIQGTVATNDTWFVGGGGTASNAGFMEIATGDDGLGEAEPIYARQYNGTPLAGTAVRTLTLLDGSGNSSFPGSVTATNGFTGNVTGNADTATQVYVTSRDSTDASHYPTFTTTDADGNTNLYQDAGFYYNPSTGTLTSTVFSGTNGTFSGDVTTGPNLYVGTNNASTTPKSIYFGGMFGDNDYNHCVIERRIWETGTEKGELLLFSGNDIEGGSGPDRIRLKGNNILFDTYATATTDRATETTKMIIKQDGKVGIGTASPGTKLDVAAQYGEIDTAMVHFRTNRDSDTNGDGSVLKLETAGNRSDVEIFECVSSAGSRFVVKANGNVGIGTTNPGEKLHVNGNLRLGSSSNNTVDDDNNREISTAGQLTIKSNDSGLNANYVNLGLQAGNVNPGQILIGGGSTDAFKTITFYTSGSSTERMRIHHNGNVGIGTGNPVHKLDVNGSVSMSGNVILDGSIQTNNTRGLTWSGDSSYGLFRGSGEWDSPNYTQLHVNWITGIVLSAGGGQYGRSYVGVNDRMAIGSSYYNSNTKPPDNGLLVQGNVGIGTNNPEKAKLQVHNTIALVSGSYKTGADDDQLAGKIEFFLGGTSSELSTPVAAIEGYDKWGGGSFYGAMAFKTQGTERMRLDQHGRVGIGVTSPLNSLIVQGKATIGTGASTTGSQYHDGTLNVIGGGTRSILTIENNSGAGDPTIILGEAGVFTEDTVPTIKKIAGTNNLSIMTAGNVGIGTTNPTSNLHVVGDINAETFYGLNDATVAYKYFDTNTTVFTFTGLNLQVGEAYKIVWHYHNPGGNYDVHMFVNGDETDTNYWHAIQQVTSTFASAGSTGNTAKMFTTGNNSDHIWVYDLRLSWDGYPMMMGHGHFSTPTSNMNASANQSWRLGTWFHDAQTNAITTLKFDPTSTGAFGAGSSIRILKMM